MNKPHKHCEVIKAWADGKPIQYYNVFSSNWQDALDPPTWDEGNRYRVKPEPKKLFARCWKNSRGHISCITAVSKDNIGDLDYWWISDWFEIELYEEE